MDIKPGIQTTEFWLTAVSNVVIALFGYLVASGRIGGAEAEHLQGLVLAAVPLALAIVNGLYAQSRATVKAGG